MFMHSNNKAQFSRTLDFEDHRWKAWSSKCMRRQKVRDVRFESPHIIVLTQAHQLVVDLRSRCLAMDCATLYTRQQVKIAFILSFQGACQLRQETNWFISSLGRYEPPCIQVGSYVFLAMEGLVLSSKVGFREFAPKWDQFAKKIKLS